MLPAFSAHKAPRIHNLTASWKITCFKYSKCHKWAWLSQIASSAACIFTRSPTASISAYLCQSSLSLNYHLRNQEVPSRSSIIVHFSTALSLLIATGTFVAANPVPTAGPGLNEAAALHKRASCSFTAASAASASKKDYARIVLDNISVPSGTTLDLTDLSSGTHVCYSLT